jgi:putative FmdB family regulatory protein
MPLYRYSCEDCRKEFEVKKPVKEYDDPVPCKYCGKDMKMQIQPVPFRIK